MKERLVEEEKLIFNPISNSNIKATNEMKKCPKNNFSSERWQIGVWCYCSKGNWFTWSNFTPYHITATKYCISWFQFISIGQSWLLEIVLWNYQTQYLPPFPKLQNGLLIGWQQRWREIYHTTCKCQCTLYHDGYVRNKKYKRGNSKTKKQSAIKDKIL